MARKSYFNLLPLLLVVALCGWFLAGIRPEFLSTVAIHTPFYTTGAFFADLQKEAGGLLLYCASALTSCYAKPWLGTLLFTAIACALLVAQPANRRTALPQLLATTAIVALILLNFTQQGYLIYLLKEPATGMTPLLGFLLVGLLVLLAATIASRTSRRAGRKLLPVYLLVVILAGYPLLGAYGLFAALLIVVRYVRQTWAWRPSGTKAISGWEAIIALAGVALIVAWPYVLASYCYTSMGVPQCYLMALPDYAFTEAEWPMWLPLMVAALLTLLLDNLGQHSVPTESLPVATEKHSAGKEKHTATTAKSSKHGAWLIAASGLLLVLSVVALTRYAFSDANFTQILRMGKAVDEARWEEVVEIAQQAEEKMPTRIEVLYRNLALQKLGRGGDELFQYPDGDAPCKAVRETSYLRLIAAAPLYYYYGKTNYAYRWCMEGMVEYGMHPMYLKYMALCAIVSGEKELARKYLQQLSHTWFYRDFATKYLAYVDQPNLVKADKDMAAVTRLMNYKDLLDGDSGLIEVYLLNSFAMMEGGTREMVELSLQDNLILKDIDGFWARFRVLYPTFKGKVPLHYQEAALLFNTLEPRFDLQKFPFSEGLRERFLQLINASAQGGAMDDDYNAEVLRSEFGQTYWYYYFFVRGLKTN